MDLAKEGHLPRSEMKGTGGKILRMDLYRGYCVRAALRIQVETEAVGCFRECQKATTRDLGCIGHCSGV